MSCRVFGLWCCIIFCCIDVFHISLLPCILHNGVFKNTCFQFYCICHSLIVAEILLPVFITRNGFTETYVDGKHNEGHPTTGRGGPRGSR